MAEYRRLLVDGISGIAQVHENECIWIDGRHLALEETIHLPPVTPTKIVCVHLSYRSRAEELNRKTPVAPTYFWKPVSCLNSHKGKVIKPKGCQYLNYEGEFALVVGRTTRNITPEQAKDYIFGYTIANDMGLHDFRDTDENSMVRVKGSDTLSPIGPGVNTDWDFRNKTIRTIVDGKVVQEASTNELIWDPYYMLADLARNITFQPGDLILTGTPAFSRPIQSGSHITVEVEGLGRLENEIVESHDPIPTTFGAQPTDSESLLKIALGSDFRPRT